MMVQNVTEKDREAVLRLQTVATELQALLEGADDLIERLDRGDAPKVWIPDSLTVGVGEWRPIGGMIDVWRGDLLDTLSGLLYNIEIALNPDRSEPCKRHGVILQTLPGGEVVCVCCGRPASTPIPE